MSSLFADTHNVVTILEKSDAAEGFEQIIDFLSGSYMYYALTVSPRIYILCIKQFWNTVSVKRTGDVTRLQALVDKKKIVISEAIIRKILQLNAAEGVLCLPNEEIFSGLAQMGYEKPSTKLTFYKAFFSSMLIVRQPAEEEVTEAQVQVDDVVAAAVEEHVAEDVSHDAIPSPPPHDIPSPSQDPSSPPQQQQSSPQAPSQDAEFPTQLQQVLNVCSALSKRVKNLENNNAAQKLVIIKLKARVKRLEKANMVKSSKLRRLRKVGASRRVESSADMEDVFNQGRMIDDMDMDEGIELEDNSEVQEVVEAMTTAKLITKVVTAAASQVSAASATIPAASATISVAAPTLIAAYTRRRKGVIIRDPEEELSLKTPAKTPKVKDKGKGILVESLKPIKKKDRIELDAEYAKKLPEEINKDYEEPSKDIYWDAGMDHVNQKSNNPQYIKRYQRMKKRPHTESEARKNMMIYLKNTAGYKMDFFKGMTYAQICLIFQARFDENIRKLSEEAQEAKDLRKHLEVVEDEDDDVFVEATPLASKVPIVDYQIVLVDNKPRFKIIRADETHQFYISFTTLLKNFDREDLENL
nr:hypothetical protein [Tanacetum cinerariifolium]